MNVEEQERFDSINRYIRGNKPANICRDVGRSKTWLFTWGDMSKNGDEGWYKSQLKAHKNHDKKTGREIENTIVNKQKSKDTITFG
jgi:hypothetical protein